MTLFLCSPTWENRGLTPFWSLPCSFTMPTSWPPGVCTTSAPTTTVFVRSSARKSNQNLQVRLCGPHLSSSHHLWLKGFPSAQGGFLVVIWQSQIHVTCMTQGIVCWKSSLENLMARGICVETGGRGVVQGALLQNKQRLLVHPCPGRQKDLGSGSLCPAV